MTVAPTPKPTALPGETPETAIKLVCAKAVGMKLLLETIPEELVGDRRTAVWLELT